MPIPLAIDFRYAYADPLLASFGVVVGCAAVLAVEAAVFLVGGAVSRRLRKFIFLGFIPLVVAGFSVAFAHTTWVQYQLYDRDPLNGARGPGIVYIRWSDRIAQVVHGFVLPGAILSGIAIVLLAVGVVLFARSRRSPPRAQRYASSPLPA